MLCLDYKFLCFRWGFPGVLLFHLLQQLGSSLHSSSLPRALISLVWMLMLVLLLSCILLPAHSTAVRLCNFRQLLRMLLNQAPHSCSSCFPRSNCCSSPLSMLRRQHLLG